jgi:hypothetical protein
MNTKMKNQKLMSIVVDVNLYNWLKKQSKLQEVTMSKIIRDLLRKAILENK